MNLLLELCCKALPNAEQLLPVLGPVHVLNRCDELLVAELLQDGVLLTAAKPLIFVIHQLLGMWASWMLGYQSWLDLQASLPQDRLHA